MEAILSHVSSFDDISSNLSLCFWQIMVLFGGQIELLTLDIANQIVDTTKSTSRLCIFMHFMRTSFKQIFSSFNRIWLPFQS